MLSRAVDENRGDYQDRDYGWGDSFQHLGFTPRSRTATVDPKAKGDENHQGNGQNKFMTHLTPSAFVC
ncbi:hypothetical protein ACVMIH_000074 [Bradyrhizobium sp. USDA 4503]